MVEALAPDHIAPIGRAPLSALLRVCSMADAVPHPLRTIRGSMDFRTLYEYCLAKPGAVETFPFNESALVFKVAGKMFALTDVNRLPLSVSLKCDPNKAVELRERYDFVRPGYHLDKRHWNTVELDGDADDEEVLQWIDHSYELVVKGLTRRQRDQISGG